VSVTTAQREILELAASRADGAVNRWDVTGKRSWSLVKLQERGYLRSVDGTDDLVITDKGRQAIR
jgi:hypothetical protein